MSEELARAQAALNAGDHASAIIHMGRVLEADPNQNYNFYRAYVTQFYRAGRHADGLVASELAIARFPRDADLLNLRGVMLRRTGRLADALAVLNQAQKLAPKNESVQVNRGNVLMDLGELARAEPVFAALSRKDPRNGEYHRSLGRIARAQGRWDQALVRLRQAVNLMKEPAEAVLDLIGLLGEMDRAQEADAEVEKALAAHPGNQRLMEGKAVTIRRSGQLTQAAAYLESLLPAHGDKAWIHFQLGGVKGDYDRAAANAHFQKAIDLEPTKLDYRMALVESLERTRLGNEGANIDAAYDLLQTAYGLGEFTVAHKKVLSEVLVRVGAYDERGLLADMHALGREFADQGRHTAFLKLLSQVRTDEDRRGLLENHRRWGRLVEETARRTPIKHPATPRPPGKIRLGLMSSDLRSHPVAYFIQSLFEDIDERFELYCYSFYQGTADPLQQRITSQVTGFRWMPEASTAEAAQAIANDQLDMLIELGGSTHLNKLEVMAFKPAPLQASWLGYPHSAGLKDIDYLIVDPYLKPEDERFMLEKPLTMPSTWIALGKLAFPESLEIDPQPPCLRDGVVTFGTANNPYKYRPDVLSTWAQVLNNVPGSRFLFIRPEGNSAHFRRNMTAAFVAEGVAADRVIFEPVRGAHRPHYNRIDIALDPFPQTGGTTTCEALWMGVPTVSLVGPTIYERLSYSILMNAGLGDLCVTSIEDYVAKSVELANDTARIADLRVNLRERLKASPLGRTEEFARDFYQMIATAVEANAPRRKAV